MLLIIDEWHYVHNKTAHIDFNKIATVQDDRLVKLCRIRGWKQYKLAFLKMTMTGSLGWLRKLNHARIKIRYIDSCGK